MKPTEEQRIKFWEWCGFTTKPFAPQYATPEEPDPVYVFDPEGNSVSNFPPIDLNNLFKYAVPFLIKKLGNISTLRLLLIWAFDVVFPRDSELKDPALALFWAIYEVIKGEK